MLFNFFFPMHRFTPEASAAMIDEIKSEIRQ